ncbi:MAG: double zinc ribbon domain-containing protein, partial [Eubacterium sp.]|nr:double zinc ribbon domain-containing protein [Eubacterium sp.]
MKKALKEMSYAVFPKRCELCGEVIEPDKTRCAECESLAYIEGRRCKKCGRETADCICKKEKFSPYYNAFTAPFYFEDNPKKA